ncbi:hypothetical protein LEP1GSC043_2478 [Leptospira weilii str. Ecochallenge]|uniref:Uncharacterized protein n=1 Tax=Leptospira weilii str. Ecochallenge TaxID=1049986 RepID=N1TUV8_9LEPT|nr:hypothetical protein LEP1GSC043_2478 [Leptospira weilii str. Ecochallenge]
MKALLYVGIGNNIHFILPMIVTFIFMNLLKYKSPINWKKISDDKSTSEVFNDSKILGKKFYERAAFVSRSLVVKRSKKLQTGIYQYLGTMGD